MKQLFEEHYVTIPEDKYDVLESMVDKLDEMETKLNEQIDRNVALNRRLAESTSDVIFAEVAEGLAETQKDKFASLAENVEFESEADYREKLGHSEESLTSQRKLALREIIPRPSLKEPKQWSRLLSRHSWNPICRLLVGSLKSDF